MKIVSWNCRQGIHKYDKFKKISELDADLYVLCEVMKPSHPPKDYLKFMEHSIYIEEPIEPELKPWHKGLAIVYKEDINIENNHWDYEYNDFLSVRVNGSFNLVAVWPQGRGTREYVRRMEGYLEEHGTKIKKSDNLVMCGDFNINPRVSGQENKDGFYNILNDYGYESIYHRINDELLGHESINTFYGGDNPVHIDYLFSKPEIISSFRIGEKEKYIGTKISDHVPLIFEVDV